MSETETILKSESGVKAYEGEHPPSVGLKAGAFADVGTIILTNQRLVYINKGGAARATMYALGGALAARATEKQVSKAELDDVAHFSGSYSIPLQDITQVVTSRHMGSSYLRVDNKCSYLKPSHSFILGSGFSKNEDWVAAIYSAIAAQRFPQAPANSAPVYSQVPTYNPPPPPTYSPEPIVPPVQPTMQVPSSPQASCPSCGNLGNVSAKFCRSCGASMVPPKPVIPPPPKPKYCSDCGSPVSATARFCESCGSKLTD
jgi:hypothetical protein